MKTTTEALLKMFKKKLETHFSIGEALSVVASGFTSTAAKDPLLVLYNHTNLYISFFSYSSICHFIHLVLFLIRYFFINFIN